jgi:hypothetical protein
LILLIRPKIPYENKLQNHKIIGILEIQDAIDAPVFGWGSQCAVERELHH